MLWGMEMPVPEELRQEITRTIAECERGTCDGDEFLSLFGDEGSLPRTIGNALVRRNDLDVSISSPVDLDEAFGRQFPIY